MALWSLRPQPSADGSPAGQERSITGTGGVADEGKPAALGEPPSGVGALTSRYLGHSLAVGLTLLVAVGAAAPPGWGVSSLRQAATAPSAFARHRAEADLLVKPPSLVTQLVNRPRMGLTTHIVREGDTLSGLAEKYRISSDTLRWSNGLEDPEAPLNVSQTLIILPVSGVLHRAEEGDKIEELAWRYQSDVRAIVDFNQLTAPDQLRANEVLIIPGGRPPEEASRPHPSARGGERPPEPAPLQVATYEVVPGDTLSAIADRFGVQNETILAANDIRDANLLQVGQKLAIPPVDGVVHQVQRGDTVNYIAARYAAAPDKIVDANALPNPDLLALGTVLVVPGGKKPPPPVMAAASTFRPAGAPAPPPPAPAPAAPPSPSSEGNEIVDIARQFLGYRYRWGGSSPSTGFDCSGFVWYVYRQAGIPLPRDLWGQLQSGPRVAQANLLPGDLVFFQNTYQPGLSHNGIYIGGRRFIHAASENAGVKVSSLSEAYWASRYFGARRPY